MISVLVTHHKPSLEPYLELALRSLAWQEQMDGKYFVHVLSSSPISHELVDKFPKFTFLIDETLNTPTLKCDYWLDNLVGDATHTMLMSNDVILSSLALHKMYSVGGECIQTPLSNNENTHRYFAELPYPGPSYELDEVDPDQVRTFNPESSLLVRIPWLSFYTPFMPTSVWKKIGRMEPLFDKKYNDSDFCFRAGEVRIPSIVNTGCYALHYGSKTTHGYMSASDEQTADKIFSERWPMNRVAGLLLG